MLAVVSPLLLALQPAPAPEPSRPLPPPGPIPGQCAEPARENAGKLGCYLAAEVRLEDPPAEIRWHLFRFTDEAAARAAAADHRWSVVTFAHDRIWLHVLSPEPVVTALAGEPVAAIGPMRVPGGRPFVARFLEARFPPGMMTRNHSHQGPEAFYVVDGVQCVETSEAKVLLGTGEGYHFDAGIAHVQSSPGGRRNMALVLYPEGEPWMDLTPDWTPTGFCNGPAEATPSSAG